MKLWTCIKCKDKFNPVNKSRICIECRNTNCLICNSILKNKRSDAKWCDKCFPIAAVNKSSKCYLDNINKKRKYDKKRRKQKPELYRAASKRNRKLHPGRKLADTIKRRLALKNRVPPWADLKAIKKIYETCPKGWHVDHIIPLQGKIVSGLHVENNLQHLPAKKNLQKSNHYSITHGGRK